MADLQFNTSIILDGPWLIEKAQLDALSKAVDDTFEKFRIHHDNRSKAAIEQDFQERLKRHQDNVKSKRTPEPPLQIKASDPQPPPKKTKSKQNGLHKQLRAQAEEYIRAGYNFSPPTRKIKIDVEGNKKLEGESIGEMLKQPVVESVRALSLDVELGKPYSAHPSCTLSISPYGSLQIRAGPDGSPIALEAFNTLKDWAVAAQAPRWQRWWLNLYGLHWLIFFIIFVVCGTLSRAQPPVSPYIKEAHALLSAGLTPQNRDKAIETTLALMSGYIPPGTPQSAPLMSSSTATAIILVALILCIIAYVSPPKFALGIGLGEKTVNLWRKWLSLLRAIPVFIVSAILIPMLRNLLASWFGGPS
ncbi:hypothetical protein HPP05_11675 [Corallococcus exiguus]|uniref:hypothetical protein n=1 Tax=Corallococcus exiguus TaxID=83462 RepID=UPI001494163B|nr:hypothetical protein [Corallococcus exiguus]NPC70407.1 hypothetical protein [Corallococcus exiguus]